MMASWTDERYLRTFHLTSVAMVAIGLVDLGWYLFLDTGNLVLLYVAAFVLGYGLVSLCVIRFQRRRAEKIQSMRTSPEKLDFQDFSGLDRAGKLEMLERRRAEGRMGPELYEALKRQLDLESREEGEG